MQRKRRSRTETDGSALRLPGASARFALFAEVLWVGVLVSALSVPIVTLPAALAAGARHLERFLRAEDSSLRLLWRDFVAALPGGLVVAIVAAPLAVVLWLDIRISLVSDIPGAGVVLAIGIAGLVLVAVALMALGVVRGAAGGWSPRSAFGWLRDDPAAPIWLVVAVGLTGIVTWQLPPLIVPALGCLLFAAVALRLRSRS